MGHQARSEFSLPRYSVGNAIQFVFENGVRRHVREESASPLPGLSMVMQLQEKQVTRDRARRSGTTDDPLSLEDLACICTPEQLCAHSQIACALARNAVAQSLQHRSEVRARRYGEAVMRLAEASSSLPDSEKKVSALIAVSPYLIQTPSGVPYTLSPSVPGPLHFSLKTSRSQEARASFFMSCKESEMAEEEEGLETHVLKHPTLNVDEASAWLQRRYKRCCNVMDVRPSATVRHRLSQCVQNSLSSTTGSSSAQSRSSPMLHHPHTPSAPLNASAGRVWMSFPRTLVLLREMNTTPYEVNADFSGCAEIGQSRHHFIVLLGVLEVCRSTVVSLNLSKTRLDDDEVRVLCLFCRTYLRRLQVMDLSGNTMITDKVAVSLKKFAALLPLLCRLTVRETSLSRTTVRTLKRIISRKARQVHSASPPTPCLPK
ncbi:hypothetical protein JKF63_01863 [Porcisia hertigi]|uniref:Uncharacterized protein n=1 Tax=Porcisia hertigi TaxID=2761500 RepID=A0A836L4C3_9TRYP|nr:hypothetical protein JKF63_01863 [Porcisia hertigi]